MRGKIFITSILIVLFSSGFRVLGSNDEKETRNVGTFSSLSLSIAAEVFITQDSKTEVVIVGDPKTIEHIETTVTKETLKIKYDTKWSVRFKKVKIYVSNPDWEGIYVSGSGNIFNKSTISSPEIDLAVSGSGNINLDDLKSEEVEARISGSGDINLTGDKKASSLGISISGSGNVTADRFRTDNVSVRISGSGDAQVYAESALEISISGSGNVTYKGQAVIDARVSGSGKVRKYD